MLKIAGPKLIDNAYEIVSELFANAHNTTKERIKEKGRPLHQIEQFLDTRVKQDPTLVRQILRVCFSAYTNNPINLGVLAPTSEGKTYATVQVTNLFPSEDVIAVARLSPTALIHANGILIDENGNEIESRLDELFHEILFAKKAGDKERIRELQNEERELKRNARHMVDLQNKILLFLDNPKAATYEMLKPLLSHDKFETIYKTTTADGSLKVKESLIRGWPAAIVCSAKDEAKDEVWPEIESRFFMTSPNTTVGKYKTANQFTADVLGVPSFASEIHTNQEDKDYSEFFVKKIKETIQKICKDGKNPVFNPFRQKIVDLFPSSQGIDMRHFKRLMSFCNIETILHAHNNIRIEFETKEKKKDTAIMTSLQDIDDTVQILGNISTLPPDKLNFYTKVFTVTLGNKLDSYTGTGEVGLTSKELSESYKEILKKPITPKQMLETYLKPLVNHGVLEAVTNPDNVSQNLYQNASTVTTHNLKDLKSKLIEAIETPSLYIWLGVVSLGKASIKSGKIKRIFDKDGDLNYPMFREKISQGFS